MFFRFNPFNASYKENIEFLKKRLYRLLLAGLIIILTCAAAYSVYDYYTTQEHLRVVAARTDMVKAQAKANNLTIISEDKIKEIVALNTGVPLKDLKFKEIGLITFDNLPAPPMPMSSHPGDTNNPGQGPNGPLNRQIPSDKNSDSSLPPIQMPPEMRNDTRQNSASNGSGKNIGSANNENGATNQTGSEGGASEPSNDGNSSGDVSRTPLPTNGRPPIPESDFSRTPPQELRKHPLYHFFAKSAGLTYELVIDGVNRHIIKSNVY
ncbi:MAG: hypothetical protein KHZ77_02780 [Veillonella sp.]|uniref:hypothetical protein n=1 Tax=Veillonella sp. TaxID=1926307 RepID=UPI0025CBE5FF|nr:hypothetical protein [Veillonella sp.]MBS4913073.1 hypothetical protein [Veillonella sp.]